MRTLRFTLFRSRMILGSERAMNKATTRAIDISYWFNGISIFNYNTSRPVTLR